MQTIITPGDYNLVEGQWWFLYNDFSKNIIIKPRQGAGKISSPHILVIGNTKEECEQYIVENNLNTQTI